MDDITASQARAALGTAERAWQHVADEVGLPRGYWWAMAAGWVVLGLLGEFAPAWLTTVATVVFGAAHSFFASRLLSGRNRTGRLQVSATVAGHRTRAVVVAMLLALVALTVCVTVLIQADGATHARVLGAIFVATVIGLGGPELLSALRRLVHA